MRVIVNGKACVVPDNATVAQLRGQLGQEVGSDNLIEEDTQGSRALGERDRVKEGTKLWSIPPIVKGAAVSRLEQEVELLRRAAGSRSQVILGTKTLDQSRYYAVLVKNVALSSQKFGVTRTDMLFLLPPQYPSLPPIGCYLNYKWPSADHHFTLQAHYGAPFLGNAGWWWYCVGLGGGFDTSGWAHRWRPGSQAGNGHNLTTLFVAARHAVNQP